MYIRFLYFIGDKVDTKNPYFQLTLSLKRVPWGGPRSQAPYCFNIIPLLSLFCLWFPLSLLFVLIPKVPNFPRNFFLRKDPKTLSSCGTS